jgi:GR25 family glycosyltransferase involved in LPS biosynthesis
MIKTNLGLDRILTISLPRRSDRKEKFNERFGRLEFNYIEAVSGMDISIPKLISEGIVNNEFYDAFGAINKNVIACSLSHLKCWEIFQASKTETCLIFEDDVIPTQEIFSTTTNSDNEVIIQPSDFWNEMMNQLKDLDWDIVYLGKKEKFVNGIEATSLFCKPFWSAGLFGAHSYMINKKSVDKIINGYKPLKYPADIYLDVLIEELNVYALKESLFRQETDIYLHDKPNLNLVDSDTFHNENRKKGFTKVKVDNIVESVEFTNYPESHEFDDKRWPPLIKAKLRS